MSDYAPLIRPTDLLDRDGELLNILPEIVECSGLVLEPFLNLPERPAIAFPGYAPAAPVAPAWIRLRVR